jgi:hypothetical protein
MKDGSLKDQRCINTLVNRSHISKEGIESIFYPNQKNKASGIKKTAQEFLG